MTSVAESQLPNSVALDRSRLAEITCGQRGGECGAATIGRALGSWWHLTNLRDVGFFALNPDLRITYNSTIPYSLNDGPMWAGKGTSLTFTAGVGAERSDESGTIRVVLAPTVVYSENRPFQVIAGTAGGRSAYSSPFHGPGPDLSADYPLRFGDRHLLRFDPGRTSIVAELQTVALGVTAENEVWGPGIRNQLVMSANAPGVPRAFVRSARPVKTRLGSLSAKLIAGTLTESPFFDSNQFNDLRSLSGLLIELLPPFDSGLTIGFERVVYAPVTSPVGGALGHAFDALLHWEALAPPGDEDPDGTPHQKADQISALFARWIFPVAGLEVYGEWARMSLPISGGELLVAPHHTLGYTIGFQWAQPRRSDDYLRLQSEFTNLEQTRVFPDRPPPTFYSGRVSPQGYTQRGQMIGAAIGPSSSQFIAVDYFTRQWQLGSYLGRIRWENDALYREAIPTLFKHDVTVLSGLRGATRTRWTDLSLDATFAYRFNYLFQNGFANPGGFRTVDVRNFTVALAATPR
jgi:hypothetical protein